MIVCRRLSRFYFILWTVLFLLSFTLIFQHTFVMFSSSSSSSKRMTIRKNRMMKKIRQNKNKFESISRLMSHGLFFVIGWCCCWRWLRRLYALADFCHCCLLSSAQCGGHLGKIIEYIRHIDDDVLMWPLAIFQSQLNLITFSWNCLYFFFVPWIFFLVWFVYMQTTVERFSIESFDAVLFVWV